MALTPAAEVEELEMMISLERKGEDGLYLHLSGQADQLRSLTVAISLSVRRTIQDGGARSTTAATPATQRNRCGDVAQR